MRLAATLAICAAFAIAAGRGAASPTGHDLALVPATLPNGVVGKPYAASIKVVGGTPSAALITCSGYGGGFGFDKLPKGVDQAQTGPKELRISGTPTEPGKFILDACGIDDQHHVRTIYEFTIAGEAEKEEADLVVKTSAPEKVGEYVRFSVTIQNRGPGKATGVVLQAALERNDTVSATRGACVDVSKIAFKCTIGDLEKGSVVRVGIVGRPPEGRKSYLLGGNVTSTSRDPDRSNNGVGGAYDVDHEADLSLKLSGPRTNLAGGSMDWLARVANSGPDDTWIRVTFTLGRGVAFEKAFPGSSCYPRADTVVCKAQLLSGKKTAFTVRGGLAGGYDGAAVTVGAEIVNDAVGVKDPLTRDNRGSVTTKLR